MDWTGKLNPVKAGLVLALLLACGSCPVSVSAAPNYFVRVWQSENGLPQNAVTSVLQTRDGYIWVGTYSGLARFDGVRFTIFDNNNTPEMSSSRVTSLYEADDGMLWIGHERGEVTCYRKGRFFTNAVSPKWVGRKINAITSDQAGDIWLVDSVGLLLRLKDGLELSPETGTAHGLVNVASDSHGKTWIARDGKLSALHDGSLMPMELGIQTNENYIQGICPSGDDQLWVTVNALIGKWDGQKLAGSKPAPWGFNFLTAMIETRTGVLAAGTEGNGLYIVFHDGETMHFTRTNGLPSDFIECIFEDREGDLWVGTSSGLAMLHVSCVATVSPPDLWQARPILSVDAGRDGSLWVGTEGAGLYRLKNYTWSHFGQDVGIGNPYIWSISEDAQGRVWLGTWGGGLFVQNGEHFERASGIDYGVNMPALLHDEDDALLIGTGTGLLRYDAGKTTWLARRQELGISDVRAITKDKEGAIWFGMLGGGLGCLKDGKLKQFLKRDGLSSDFVQCLHFESDGTLWIGTFGGGLNRLKQGRFTLINKSQGLPDDVICDIEEDRQGFFWISSHGGIIRVSKAELNLCADGLKKQAYCQSYGMGDGLPTIECSGGLQPAGSQTADGRVWFPTSKGLVVIDPQNVSTNLIPPPVVIERLLVDEQVAFEGSRTLPLQVSPGQHRFEFQYTGLSFVDPDKVHFKYRLNSWETEWVDAQKKRVADYNYIPPGKYDFQVMACNNDGIWDQTSAEITFTVLPYFWQTWWFRILGGVATLAFGGGVMWYDTRRRMRFKLGRIERQRALENERSRIAHDIHDDLGATLTRITMISESVQDSSRNPQESEADFKQIYDSARELTRAMDEIVWAVNPKHDTLESLVNYLQKFAQDFLNAAGIRCWVDVPFQIPPWPMTAEARHNLFLAFKEALNNVAKHASATQVRISLILTEPRTFNLSVEDDGCGFIFEAEPRASKSPGNSARFSSGNGLENMMRRLAKIGGSCRIISGNDGAKGTKVVFSVALKQT
jgi:signal transduction histidine kinase/ligand-binding sensor domain-containing protein